MSTHKVDKGTEQLDKANKRSKSKTGQRNRQGGSPGSAQNSQVQESDDLSEQPRRPGGHLDADELMDEDTGLSRQSVEVDEGSRQIEQSNVGRRDDGTPD
jgi:hypothetical protein